MIGFPKSNFGHVIRSSAASTIMDSFSNCLCSEIILEIIEDIADERQDVDRNFDAGKEDVENEMTGLKNFEPDKSTRNEKGLKDEQVEEVFTEDPFDEGDTEEIVCTEILENRNEEGDKTVESNDLNVFSWFDLFNDAYGSWGRENIKRLEASHIDAASDNYKAIPDDLNIEQTELDASLNPDDKPEMDPNEEVFQDPDKDLTFETFYKAFLDVQDFNISEIEEHQVVAYEGSADEGTSGVQTIESEYIFNESYENESEGGNTDSDDQPTRTPTKKAKVECRRSTRLSSKALSGLGSMVNIEEEDGIKIVLRRSSRLAKERKGPGERDKAGKNPKK